MSRYRVLGLFAFLALAWGGLFPIVKATLPYFPPVLFSALRYDIGAVVLLVYAAATSDRFLPRTAEDRLAVLSTGVFIVAGSGLLFVGQQFLTSAVAAVLYSTIPVITAALAWFVLADERLSAAGMVGVVVGFLGATVVARPDPSNLLTPDLVGKAVILVAAASVSVGTVMLRRRSPTVSRAGLMGWAMLLGATITHAGSLAAGESIAAIDPTPLALAALAYVGVVPGAAAFVAFYALLSRVGAVQVNLVSYVVPLVATAVGWALLGEVVGATTVAGFTLILVGFVLIKRRTLTGELRATRSSAD